MASTAKKKFKSYLTFFILTAVMAVAYVPIRYLLGAIFGLFGGEDGVGWQPILIVCAVITVALIIAMVVMRLKGAQGCGREVVVACSKVMLIATIMFGGFVLLERLFGPEEGIDASFDTVHWLSLGLSLGLFNYLYERKLQRDIKNDENALVVAAECQDAERALAIAEQLESAGIMAMIVQKGSPVYIKGSDAAVQVQVCRKDLKAAQKHIAE